MDVTALSPFVLIAAVIVGVLGVARLTRLVVLDTWPPIAAIRMWWYRRTMDKDGDEGPWYALVSCPYCAAPYITAVVLAWALLTDLHWSWWVFNGWLAAAYVASIIVVKDGE